MRYLTEACQPYASHAGMEPPAHISGILDRLDTYELRSLAALFCGASPARFEEALREIWEQRRRYQSLTDC